MPGTEPICASSAESAASREHAKRGSVAVVTDSTGSLTPREVDRFGIAMVPLEVVWGGVAHDETTLDPGDLLRALRARARVTTSRPAPVRFADAFARAEAQGAREIVCVQLSAAASGTCEAARLAAAEAKLPVRVVDSRQLAMGVGYCALAGGARAQAGGTSDEVVTAVREQARRNRVFFAVDTLEYLRRGGRVSLAGAVFGSALAVKPLLEVHDGQIRLRERVRTNARASDRLLEWCLQALADLGLAWGQGTVVVQHLGAFERAHELAARICEAVGVPVDVRSVSAVVGAHVGPGVLGVAVTDPLW